MSDVSRRRFLAGTAGSLSLVLLDSCARADTKIGNHHIPAEKGLSKAWVDRLFARGRSKIYRGAELTCTGMPIGGLCAGQLYLRGDGTLADWHIFNHNHFTGYGDTNYRAYTPPAPVQQGFALWVKPANGEPQLRTLDRKGFPAVEFVGEYPVGRVRYVRGTKDPFPVDVSLEAFSPFVPLNAQRSATPGTILRFTVRNTSAGPVEASLGGWLENVVCAQHAGKLRGQGRNSVRRAPGLVSLLLEAEQTSAPKPSASTPPEVFADFESGSYAGWTATGTAFGSKPASGTFPHQQPVTGFGGKYLVNSYHDDDRHTGTLTSRSFTIRRPYINFKIGGGDQPGQECINLVVKGNVVRTATGRNREHLEWDFWDVADLRGQTAHFQIVDHATGGWGHINIDDIQFADEPPRESRVVPLRQQPDFGTLALSVLGTAATASTDGFADFQRDGTLQRSPKPTAFPLGKNKVGALASPFTLAPGESREVVFLVTWHFAQAPHGRMYSRWYRDALAVAEYLKQNLEPLTQETRLFHSTYYDSTLPHWLLDRIMMPISTLATDTCQWWANGRFWAWEGVGCCDGTCTHVWNYAQGMAYLFPELERSAREQQDLAAGFDAKTGRVGFRGENPNEPYAADGQCGTVLKCYREHRMSGDDTFLKRNWPRIKKVMEYEITRDGNGDGIIEDKQWNTFDLAFVGPNTFVGALYLAALEAAARMAEPMNDRDFAVRCRSIAARGSAWTSANLYNGEYFTQRIPRADSDRLQYGIGCLSDQLFGQNWADQLGLGYVYPVGQVRTALKAVYKYNWAPDIAAQNKQYPPQRWFVRPGDAGLFVCTWPRGDRPHEPILYRDEVWTGGEYQLASHLLREGFLREGLSIVRGIHDRYDGRRHNPFNEVECGDHYARALASWGCLLALAGFDHDGPAGRLGFAPRWQPENFRCFFTAAEGWGTLDQRRQSKTQTNGIHLQFGQLRLRELSLELPEGATLLPAAVTLRVARKVVAGLSRQEGRAARISLGQELTLKAGQALEAVLQWT